jgi:dTDP-4-amino-4,6-dideoxygalactose transaminase
MPGHSSRADHLRKVVHVCYTYDGGYGMGSAQGTVVSASSKLAIEGGRPIRTAPFPNWPQFDAVGVEAVSDVLRSGRVNYWTGDEGRRFEQEFAAYSGTRHAIAVSNGTVALELALHALGVGSGDEVIVPSRTFIASASCVAMRGARPVMADVDRESQTLTAETAREAITTRTKAIIAVHLAGWPCDMDSIMSLARESSLAVVEDCAQAHGARYQGQPVGSMGHISAFSFCQDKIMTTGGEGGMVTTNDDALWSRAWSYKDHGKRHEALHRRDDLPGLGWRHDSFGTNWRLTEMQSALGRQLLRKLDEYVERRRQFAGMLNDAFSAIPSLRTTLPPNGVHHSYYKYYAFVRPEKLRGDWDRDRIMAAIEAEGVPCFVGGCSEIYLEKAFDGIRPLRRLPIARELGETSLMFQVHPTLADADIHDIIAAVQKVIGHASC